MGERARGLLGVGVLLVTAAAAACAARSGQVRPEGASVGALEVERVAQILERHHPSHAPLDAATARRAYARLLDALDPDADCPARDAALVNDGERIASALRAADFRFAADAARSCLGRELAPQQARAFALDALAAAYDPYCRHLDRDELAARRAQARAHLAAAARGRNLEHEGERAGWIELPSFYLSTERSASADALFLARELHARGASVLVLDLRGNGGGVVAEAERLAGALLGGGALAHERDADGRVQLRASAIRVPAWIGPLLILVDRRTGSVAELFTAALQDRGRALIAGERSYGKGLATTLVLLSSPLGTAQGAVEVSERAFYRLDGRVLQGQGVTPDVELPPDPAAPPRAPAFVAPWLPERIAPLAHDDPPARLDPRAIAAARTAGRAPAVDEAQRLLAIATAYARRAPAR